eukprot:NODE_1198_length_2565_cov_3.534865.p1 GENE.NODE_1198_length_2565_cov_3.534865~~NODE_1198_length_2565_cov_3.534865.p1  ORF type:complete len:829 (+),score=199.93 NODE_1198_length_2565_cov_3.534865:55-2487(+)
MIAVSRKGRKTILHLEEDEGADNGEKNKVTATEGQVSTERADVVVGMRMNFELRLTSLGLSVVEDHPMPRELLFVLVDLVRFRFEQCKNDIQQIKVVLSEIQVDCQLPGRIDGSAPGEASQTMGTHLKERQGVILANVADGDRPCLTFKMMRGDTSSQDFILPYLEVNLDMLDVTLDDELLNHVMDFVKRASGAMDDSTRGVKLAHVRETAGVPIIANFVMPPLPAVMQVDTFKLSRVELSVWCSLQLRSLNFLPRVVAGAIRVMSFSGSLTLNGARLTLPDRSLPQHRGSVVDFCNTLGHEYLWNLMRAAASVLGKSSLMNVPRVPLKLGGAGMSYITETLGMAAGEASGLVAFLSFDQEFIDRQAEIRRNKNVKGVSDGFFEAGKSITQGVGGIFDIVRKPVQGAQEGGVAGFFKGFGTGLTSAITKPAVGLGNAVQDMGQGVAAQVNSLVGNKTEQTTRALERTRERLPRLLYGEQGVLRPFSEADAVLLHQLGLERTNGAEVIVPLHCRRSDPKFNDQEALLLFKDHILFVNVRTQADGNEAGKPSSSSGGRLIHQAFRPLTGLARATGVIEARSKVAEVTDSRVMLKSINNVSEAHPLSLSNGEKSVGLDITYGKGATLSVYMPCTGGSDWIRAQLTKGFDKVRATADTPGHAGNPWEAVTEALDAERRRLMLEAEALGSTSKEGAGGRMTLEVFEVERQIMQTNDWKTPFLPTDFQSAWRWLDSSGQRHPHLVKEMSWSNIVGAKEPPCELELFRPIGPWKKEVDEKTDREGWKYAIAWNSSTWETKMGFLDVVRKRRWTRVYE